MNLLNKYKDPIPKEHVYIGRGSVFGNLKVIGKDGTRAEVIEWYRGWFISKVLERDLVFESAFKGLNNDSNLLCFCKPAPCHGDVIMEQHKIMSSYGNYEDYVNSLKDKEVCKTDVPKTLDDYKYWLVSELTSRNPHVTKAFRENNDPDVLVPFEYRSLNVESVLVYLKELLFCEDDYNKSLITLKILYFRDRLFTPATDGLDHINIYSKGNTLLGKMLSNFYPIGFIHPTHGEFKSIEGYWYWLSTGLQYDVLKTLHGFEAKKVGSGFPRVALDTFEPDIKEALRLKISGNYELSCLLRDSDLPLAHYYSYGKNGKTVQVEPKDNKWVITEIEKIRNELKGRSLKLIIAGSRTFNDYSIVKEMYLNSGFYATEIISGGAKGADKLGERLAEELNIPLTVMKADWDGQGKAAGAIRNAKMGDTADALIAVIENGSSGTTHMVKYMKDRNKKVLVKELVTL